METKTMMHESAMFGLGGLSTYELFKGFFNNKYGDNNHDAIKIQRMETGFGENLVNKEFTNTTTKM